jgi:hypothetical protein
MSNAWVMIGILISEINIKNKFAPSKKNWKKRKRKKY